MLEIRAGKLERKGSLTKGAKLQACRRAKAWTARDGAALHERKIPSVTVLRHDGTKQS